MSSHSDVPASRFRSVGITLGEARGPEAQLEEVLGDGELLMRVLQETVRDAVEATDATLVLRLGRIALRSEDPFRRIGAHRVMATATAIVSDELARAGGDWAAPLDDCLGLLVEALDAAPHEPDLLDLLGVFAFRLGAAEAGRACIVAACELEPTRTDFREHHAGCAAAPALRPAPGSTPNLDRSAPRIADIAARATALEPRTISLCMIVKDEEELLPGCLEAIAPFVDQMVVVDTGSTDSTREIAAGHGADVHDFTWTGSFSDARNEALRHCTGDWILWLDADEHLVVEDGPLLRELARRTWVEGFHVVETHFMGADEAGSEASHSPMRLFRRRPEYRWSGRVHEQVAGSLPAWLPGRVQHAPIRVNHYGYLSRVVEGRGKRSRNLDLLMDQLADGGHTAFGCFNVGTEHASAGEWSEALRWFEEALALAREEDVHWHEQPFAPLMVQRTVTARRIAGDVEGVHELVEAGLGFWPRYTDLVFERATMQFERGLLDAAEEDLLAALALGDAPARFVSVAGKGSFQARTLLARVEGARGAVAAARAHLEQVIGEAPRYLSAIVELARLRLAAGDDAGEVDASLDALLDGRNDGIATNLLLGGVFHECGHLTSAGRRYDRALARRPDHAGALLARGELRLAQGRLEEAWHDGIAIDALDPLAAHGAATSFLAAVALDRTDLLDEPAKRIADSDLAIAERATYAAWRAQIAGTDGVTSILAADRVAANVVFRNLEALAKLEATDAFEQLHALTAQVEPDERERRLRLAELYTRCHFTEMAGEELLTCAERFGPDARTLGGLGTVATLKGMWEDAEVFLTEALHLDPERADIRRLLEAVRTRRAG